MGKRPTSQSGFTLVEILVALAILGGSLFVLLETHYAGLDARVTLREKALMQGMEAKAIGMAETNVLAGELTGGGDYGQRFEGYTYDYEAVLVGETLPGLYEVVVRVNHEDATEPNETRFFVYSSVAAMEMFAATGGGAAAGQSPGGEQMDGGMGRGQSGRGRGSNNGQSGFDRNQLPANIRDRLPDNIDPAMIERYRQMMRQRGGG